MTTISVLITGVLLLLFGQRFWGRLVDVTIFQHQSHEASLGLIDRFGKIGQSNGILSLFGISLAITWGWAPMFVWTIIVMALFIVFIQSGVTWLRQQTNTHSIFLHLESILGKRTAIICKIALLSPLILAIPFLLAICILLIIEHPNILQLLGIHLLLSLVIHKIKTYNQLLVLGTLLLSLVLIIFASSWIAENVVFSLFTTHSSNLIIVGSVICLVVLFINHSDNKFICNNSVASICAPITIFTGLGIVLIIVLEQPDIVVQPYFQQTTFFGAVPLLFAALTLGLPSLITLLNSPRKEIRRHSYLPFYEGCFALLILTLFLCLPGKYPELSFNLPNWFQGLTPIESIQFLITSFTKLASHLPFRSETIHLFLIYLTTVSCLILASNLFSYAQKTARSLPSSNSSRIYTPSRLINITQLSLLAGYLILGFSTHLWILMGTSTLLFLCLLCGIIMIGALRFQHPILLISILAATALIGYFILLAMAGFYHYTHATTQWWIMAHSSLVILSFITLWHLIHTVSSIRCRR